MLARPLGARLLLWRSLVIPLVVATVAVAGCSQGGDDPGGAPATAEGRAPVRIVTTVSPLRSIAENVGGDRVVVVGLVPEGTNAHTFEPQPSAAREIGAADLIVVNGLNLELPTMELATANARDGVTILQLGENTISPEEYVFDFSFPPTEGNPNPHLWTAPHLAARYAQLVADALAGVDPDGAAYYEANAVRFRDRLEELDALFFTATATIPEQDRKLLTYHDSFPFFAARYGLEIIGAVQPSDFSEPSPRDVGALIRQIREAGVPAVFGSAVFPSEVLELIASEAGAVQVNSVRDDDLPGDPGDPDNTYVAMMVENVRTIVTALGGDAGALAGFNVGATWIPFARFEG